jgi:pilus assembly protein CpaB
VALAPPDALHDIGEAVGKLPSTPILSGQIVLRRQLEALPQALQDNTGSIGDAARALPDDKVLAAFPATDLLNSTGVVQVGDHVDLLLSIPYTAPTSGQATGQGGNSGNGARGHLVSQMTLQDVTVFNVGSWQQAAGQGQIPSDTQSVSGAPTTGTHAAPGVGTGPSVITFMVSPQEALVLKFVKDSGGSVDMVLRSSSNTKQTSTDPVDSQYIIEHYGFNNAGQATTDDRPTARR